MIKVGLTGGIGSGKTFIAQIFQQKGIPVYNSDDRGKYLMSNNPKVKNLLIKTFGSESFTQKGLNREYLAKLVFSDPEKLKAINSIVHPAVQSDFNNWCKSQLQVKYIIKEAAILIESESYRKLDYLIVVTAPSKLRIERIQKRDNLTSAEISSRIKNQLSDSERTKYANFIINNDGTMLVNNKVQEIHDFLLNLK